jgi:hypothetical protein
MPPCARPLLLIVASLVGLSTTRASIAASPADSEGKLRFDGPAVFRLDCEARGALEESGGRLVRWMAGRQWLVSADGAVGDIVGTDPRAIEGSSVCTLADGAGLLFRPRWADEVAGKTFQVRFWAYALGEAPELRIAYGGGPSSLQQVAPLALVRAVRTERATSDGWAEYSTGPIDGQVFDQKVTAVALVPPYQSLGKGGFLIDALEVEVTPDPPVRAGSCTQATRVADCSSRGDCIFGRCADASAVWGPLPPRSHREEITARAERMLMRIGADRHSLALGTSTNLAAALHELAEAPSSSRDFVGGLNRLALSLRNEHTTIGAPSTSSAFRPLVGTYRMRGAVEACFGLVIDDLGGDKEGWAIFDASATSPFKTGDILVRIEDLPAADWVTQFGPNLLPYLSGDPRQDRALIATELSELLTYRASRVDVVRCKTTSSCSAADRQTIRIDLSALSSAEAIDSSYQTWADGSCDGRFKPKAFATSDASGNDVISFTDDGDVRHVAFNGFTGGAAWRGQAAAAFDGTKRQVLVDARLGNGGKATNTELLVSLLRNDKEPIAFVRGFRGFFDTVSDPDALAQTKRCLGPRQSPNCSWIQGFSVGTGAPAASSRVAWLTSGGASANDFAARLLKGRTNLRIMGPTPTAGAFGLSTPLPPLHPLYVSPTIQATDARFGSDLSSAMQGAWESGTGVAPDEVVAQRMSDLLAGRDTIIERAIAWLSGN